jgi:hypothetical protein
MGLDILRWPPIPAQSLNQKNVPKGIPFESPKCHPALVVWAAILAGKMG